MCGVNNHRSTAKKPLVVVVHASTKYDRSASTRGPIQETINRVDGTVLEIEERICSRNNPSHLGSQERLVTNQEYAGTLWFDKLSESGLDELILGTDTFVFLGGKATQCLLNTFLSILLAKRSPLESLFGQNASTAIIQRSSEALWVLPLNEETSPLNFHFNCQAIYPSQWGFTKIGLTEEECDWSPNLPWRIMAAIYCENHQILDNSGLVVREFVDGEKITNDDIVPENAQRPINLYYWSSAQPMVQFFESQSSLEAAVA